MVAIAAPVTEPSPDFALSLRRCSMVAVRALAVVVAVLIAGNLTIFGLHLFLRTEVPAADVKAPIKNLEIVDDHLWRGAAPGKAGYEALAANGVVTIVDLRAEEDIKVDEAHLESLGIRRVHLPVRDGQAPAADVVQKFLDVVNSSPGRVYVHCGAGVGRTGTMAAAYLVDAGEANGMEAVKRNLAVGPPSLEQVIFGLRGAKKPPAPVVALSRTLDAPRRLLVNVRGSYTKHAPE